MALDGKIKLPLAGEVPKKGAAIGAGVVVLFVGIAYYRHRKNAATTNASPAGGTAAASAGDTGQVTDPSGNVCSALAASGYCPGSPEDQAYQEQQGYYGSGGVQDQYGGDTGGYGAGFGITGGGECSLPDGSIGEYDSLGNCVPIGGSTGTTTTAAPATADQWVVQTATMIPGSAATFETAAAKIFAGLTVTTAQKDLFLEGVGLNPLPPGVTYPTPIKTSDTSGQPKPGPKPTAGTVTVPNEIGKRAEVAGQEITSAGLVAHVTPGTPKGKTGIIQSQTPGAGAKVKGGSTVTLHNKIS
jgi:hypothetical protein